jgi:hypothetical protein
MFSKKISFDQDKTTLFTSILCSHKFPMNINLFIMMSKHHIYLTFQSKFNLLNDVFPINELLDKRTLSFSLLLRIKSYHVACRERSQLICLYDLEGSMCLCNEDRFANCLHYNFSSKSRCQQRSVCENDGECFSDRESCPTSHDVCMS